MTRDELKKLAADSLTSRLGCSGKIDLWKKYGKASGIGLPEFLGNWFRLVALPNTMSPPVVPCERIIELASRGRSAGWEWECPLKRREVETPPMDSHDYVKNVPLGYKLQRAETMNREDG